jgi:hypothetical protein
MPWRFGRGNTGEIPSRADRQRKVHPRVECPVCGSPVATVASDIDEVVAMMLAGRPVPVKDHAPCKYSEDDTREIDPSGILRPRS